MAFNPSDEGRRGLASKSFASKSTSLSSASQAYHPRGQTVETGSNLTPLGSEKTWHVPDSGRLTARKSGNPPGPSGRSMASKRSSTDDSRTWLHHQRGIPSSNQASLSHRPVSYPSPRMSTSETIRPRARPSPSKTTSPPGPHWLTDDDEFVRQSQKRSFDQFASGGSGSSGMRAARMTAVAMTGAPRSNTSASKINIREKFPQLRDAEMAPGGVLKILDGGETEDTATERVEALRGRLASKAARKFDVPRKPPVKPFRIDDSDSDIEPEPEESGSDSDSGSQTDRSPSPPIVVVAPPTNLRPPPTIQPSPDKAPPGELLTALERLSLSSLRMQHAHPRQLPFLLRNLRKGFRTLCQTAGVSTKHSFPQGGVNIWYSVGANGGHRYKSAMKVGWVCPLCEFHGVFENKYMLGKHLEWDHREVTVSWQNDEITLILPEPSCEEDIRIPSLPPRTPSPTTTQPLIPPSPVHQKLKYQFHTPATPSTSHTRSISTTASPSPSPLITLGPAAQPPYLPYGSVHYSCRPGGPRLFDLLRDHDCGAGVLEWEVTEIEDEIFELNDVRDEDKVMWALWGRWRIKGRSLFIKDFFKGVMNFVDTYWELIQLAAGWKALQVWLLMLVLNRFLTGTEVVRILRHYEVLTGMAEEEWPI